METDVSTSLTFEVFGLKEHSKNGNTTTYRKYITASDYVEVSDSRGIVSVDLINGDNRMVVACRYECLTQNELNFILTRGRAKFVLTAE